MKHNAKLFLALPLALLLGAGSPHAQLSQYNFEQAISGMMSAGSRAAQVSHLRNLTGIVVIRLRWIVVFRTPGEEPNVAAISISAQKNAAGIARLRSALQVNPVTRAALADKGISISRVVAVKIVGGGYLKVFIL